MPRKPIPGSDGNNWGSVLNEYLDALTPSPGEVIVGGADGPVAVRHVSGPATSPEMRIPDINAFAVEGSGFAPTTWQTPDGSGVVVHPSVRYFPEGFNGYQWWAAATPYPNSNNQLENPCVFVSTNGLDWTPPPGLTNPLVGPPASGGYNSDPYLTQDRAGRFLLYYRESRSAGTERVRLLTSGDGVAWDGPVTVLETNVITAALAAPSVWWDARTSQWVMVGTEFINAPRAMWRYTADAPEGPWTFDQVVSVAPAWPGSDKPWHMDAMCIGSQVVGVVQVSVNTGGNGQQYLVVSNDSGKTFTRARQPFSFAQGYKSALLPRLQPDGLGLDIWRGGGSPGWGVSRCTLVGTSHRMDAALERGLAMKGVAPYVIGDDFNRADSPTLGTATTGQVWSVLGGQFGILGNAAVAGGVANNRSTLATGSVDYEVSVTITPDPSANVQGWLLARLVDGNNYLRFGVQGDQYQFHRITGGAVTHVIPALTNMGRSARRVTLRCQGDRVTALIEGNVVASVTETQGQAAGTVGMQSDNASMRFDDFTVKAL